MRPIAQAVAGAAVLAAVLLMMACGSGGGALTLERYLRQVDRLQDETDARFAEQDEIDIPDQDASESEIADVAKEAFGRTIAILRDALNEARDLDLPDEAQAAHGELIESLTEVIDTLQPLLDSIPDAVSLDELNALDDRFDTPAVDAAYERFGAACVALQTLADDNGIDIDLSCEE